MMILERLDPNILPVHPGEIEPLREVEIAEVDLADNICGAPPALLVGWGLGLPVHLHPVEPEATRDLLRLVDVDVLLLLVGVPFSVPRCISPEVDEKRDPILPWDREPFPDHPSGNPDRVWVELGDKGLIGNLHLEPGTGDVTTSEVFLAWEMGWADDDDESLERHHCVRRLSPRKETPVRGFIGKV